MLYRTSERRVVIASGGRAFYAPFDLRNHEIWDILVSAPDGRKTKWGHSDGKHLAQKGILTENQKRECLSELAEIFASGINQIHAGEVEKGGGGISWDETAACLWSSTAWWLLGGGMVEGNFGIQYSCYMQALLGRRGIRLQLSTMPRWTGVFGSANFLPLTALSREVVTNYVGLDLGGSSLKIAIIHVNSKTGRICKPHPLSFAKIYARPKCIPYGWDVGDSLTPAEKRKMREAGYDWIVDAIVNAILDSTRAGINLAPSIVMGIPSTIDQCGRILTGEVFPLWKADDVRLSRIIEEKIVQRLQDAAYAHQIPDTGNLQEYAVAYDNDAVIAATAVPPPLPIQKYGTIIWGSGVGGALYFNALHEAHREFV